MSPRRVLTLGAAQPRWWRWRLLLGWIRSGLLTSEAGAILWRLRALTNNSPRGLSNREAGEMGARILW